MIRFDQTRYILDTNVLIEAHRKYYAFDICPGFWSLLEERSADSIVVSIDRVKAEIVGDDPLAVWAASAPPAFFQPTAAPNVHQEFAYMMRWVQSRNYSTAAVSKFARVADGWLVAYSRVVGATVVTLERNNPDKLSDVPIPVLCDQFSVKWTDPFTMLRDLGASFK